MGRDVRKLSLADIIGPWKDDDDGWESGLISRCKKAWNKQLCELTREEMATFLRQKLAVNEILPLAREAIQNLPEDGTELFEGELKEIIEKLDKEMRPN